MEYMAIVYGYMDKYIQYEPFEEAICLDAAMWGRFNQVTMTTNIFFFLIIIGSCDQVDKCERPFYES